MSSHTCSLFIVHTYVHQTHPLNGLQCFTWAGLPLSPEIKLVQKIQIRQDQSCKSQRPSKTKDQRNKSQTSPETKSYKSQRPPKTKSYKSQRQKLQESTSSLVSPHLGSLPSEQLLQTENLSPPKNILKTSPRLKLFSKVKYSCLNIL